MIVSFVELLLIVLLIRCYPLYIFRRHEIFVWSAQQRNFMKNGLEKNLIGLQPLFSALIISLS